MSRRPARLSQEDALAVARAQVAAVEQLKKPQPTRVRPPVDYGDGDLCPDNPDHGHMYVRGNRQVCMHHEHDGRPMCHPLGASPPTRSIFPLFP